MKLKLPMDLKLIEQSLVYAFDKKLANVFINKNILKKILIITYDRNYLYIFTTLPLKIANKLKLELSNNYFVYKIAHRISFDEHDYGVWCAGIKNIKLLDYLPEDLKKTSQLVWPRISGPVASEFIKYHQQLKRESRIYDPYYTPESFMATIIHELGHAYFDNINQPWHGIKEENLDILQFAYSLYCGQKAEPLHIKNMLSPPIIASEMFAFCCEYFASTLYWPTHLKLIDTELKKAIPIQIKEELRKDLNFQISVLDQDPHFISAIFGKIILTKYKSDWPKIFKASESMVLAA